jgi:type I restriction enzyme S subunit
MYGAPAGQVGILRFECSTNQAVCGILPNENFIPEFLYYKFLAGKDALVRQAVGGAQPNISQIKIKNTLIPAIPLPEQQRIVKILDKAFVAINKAKQNAEQNLRNTKEVFESYLQGVFENKGDDWEVKKLGEVADIEYGYTDKSTEYGEYRYIRITDIDKNGQLIPNRKKYIKHSKEAEGFLIQNNNLLMARTGATFAKVLLYKDYEKSVFASYLIRIKFKEKIDNEFYWYFTKTSGYWKQASVLSSGAAQPHFNGVAVKKVIFQYPKSIKKQKLLIDKFQDISAETKKLEVIYQQKITNLEELKKSILQKAFKGEL